MCVCASCATSSRGARHQLRVCSRTHNPCESLLPQLVVLPLAATCCAPAPTRYNSKSVLACRVRFVCVCVCVCAASNWSRSTLQCAGRPAGCLLARAGPGRNLWPGTKVTAKKKQRKKKERYNKLPPSRGLCAVL